MANTKKAGKYCSSMKDALESFNLPTFKAWVRKYNPALWKEFKKASEEVQMATMCKMICNRTDLLATEAHKQAVRWLKDHNMRGMIF